jgi:hypothetical protein
MGCLVEAHEVQSVVDAVAPLGTGHIVQLGEDLQVLPAGEVAVG